MLQEAIESILAFRLQLKLVAELFRVLPAPAPQPVPDRRSSRALEYHQIPVPLPTAARV